MNASRRAATALFAFAAAALIFLHVFRAPWSANVGLDPSWQIGLTEAHVHGLRNGIDIVYTYGPLGFLTMGAVTEQTYRAALFFAVATALLWAGLAAASTCERIPLAHKIAYIVGLVLAVTPGLSESLFSLTIAAWTLPMYRDAKARPGAALALGLFSGFVSLTKFQLALTAGAGGFVLFALRVPAARRAGRPVAGDLVALASFVTGFLGAYGFFFARSDYGVAAALGLLIAALACALVWSRLRFGDARLWAGAGLACALGLALAPSCRSFTLNAWAIASGYSSAMSLTGSPLHPALALCCFALVGLVLFANLDTVTVPLAAALCLALFVAFKEGFVRQGPHGIFFFVVAFLIAVATARLAAGTRRFLIANACVLVLLVPLDVVGTMYGSPELVVTAFAPATLAQETEAVAGAAAKSPDQVAADVAHNLSPDRFADDIRARIGDASVEALPVETSAVFANGFRWDPDPVFQTFQVDTPALDRLNAAHLEAGGADRILFQWGEIDGRYSLWDAPAAARTIFCRYGVDPRLPAPVSAATFVPMLVLARTAQRCGTPSYGAVQRYGWNDPIPVPAHDGTLTFAEISARYSIAGRIAKTLYQIPAVEVDATLDGGEQPELRIVADVAGDGVLVDPFPQTLLEFGHVLAGAGPVQHLKRFSLRTTAPYLYAPDIEVVFVSIPYGGSR
jgi:hypothetical protein